VIFMNKLGSRVSSGKAGRMPKANASNKRGSGGPRGRLDPEVERWLATAGTAFPASRSSIIPMLQSAQTTLGYLPRDAMQAIARHVVMPPAQVEGVASFYAQFRFDKPGRHRVTVCSGTACYVRGSGKLMESLQADLKIVPGKTTADGEVTLESVSCFGACALAPVVVVDDKVLRQQTTDSLKHVIKDFSAQPAGNGQCSGACRGHSHEEGAND
jgi:NADH-quinone oxidoreductase subunit E